MAYDTAFEQDRNGTPTQGPPMPERPRAPMPDWQQRQLKRLLEELSEWRNADHEDRFTLGRSEIICLLDALRVPR